MWNSFIPGMSAKWKNLIVSAVNSSRSNNFKLHIIRYIAMNISTVPVEIPQIV